MRFMRVVQSAASQRVADALRLSRIDRDLEDDGVEPRKH